MANTFALTWTNDPAFDTLDSQLVASAAGEDVGFAFTVDTGSVNVTTWTIEFNVAPSSGRNPILTIASGSITKGSGGNITFTVPKADTESFPTRSYYWELIRTDAGNRKVLAFGSWEMTGSPSLYPAVTIPPTIIPLEKGGTGSDLSETGPAVIIQAAAEANLSALAADLANTTLYLRKDLTWQLPTGSVPGTVTSVSVVTANGVSGTVATATTTPAITISLGAITPSSVNGNTITTGTGTLTLSTFTLTVTGTASVSGTNTGDQTNISGNAATVSVIDASADTTTWLMVATSQTGNMSPATDAGITYDASTDTLTIGVASTSLGKLVLSGNTSGYVQIQSAAAAGSWTLTLPPNDGSSGQFLQTDGNGVTTWQTAASVPTTITVANEASDATCFPCFFTAATGDLGPKTNANLTFDSTTGNLSASILTTGTNVNIASTGAINFGAGNMTVTHSTGLLTVAGGNLTISSGSVTAAGIVSTGNIAATTASGSQIIAGGSSASNAAGWATIIQAIGAATAGISVRRTSSPQQYDMAIFNGNWTIYDVTQDAVRISMDSTGKVAIGSTTFTSLLNVGTSAAFQITSAGLMLSPTGASGAANLARSYANDTDTGEYSPGANQIAWQTGGTTAWALDSSQNGTLNGILAVNKTGIQIVAGGTTGSASNGAGWGGFIQVLGAATAGISVRRTSSPQQYDMAIFNGNWTIYDVTQDATRISMDSTGKVAIGSTTFTSLLNVGTGAALQVDSSGRLFLPNGASGAGNLALSFVGDTNTGVYRSASDEMSHQCGGSTVLTLTTSGAAVTGTLTSGQNTVTSATIPQALFKSTATNVRASASVGRAANNAEITIGCAAATNDFVTGTAAGEGIIYTNYVTTKWHLADSATIALTISSSGAVGINNQSPATKLDVKGSSGGDIAHFRTNGGVLHAGVQWDTGVGIFFSGASKDLRLSAGSDTGANAHLVLNAAGTSLTFADALNIAVNTSTGTKIGTATGQKLGFWNATPVVQQVLATGAAHTVDDVITLLQLLGLCKQS